MGTHPIFESDFDCLTDMPKTKKTKHVDAEIDNKDWLDLTSDEGVCLICCSVLNEPIQLPCRCRTRMKCTMCRVCFKRMVDDNASECRSACPVCGQRLLNWMRGVSKDESDYSSVVNAKLWAAVQEQFQPYNQNGKVAQYSLDAKRILTNRGVIQAEYNEQQEQVRRRFLNERQGEEVENLRLLTTDPQLSVLVEEQVKAIEEIEQVKQRKKIEEQDAELARKLMEEEKENAGRRINVKLFTKKRAASKTTKHKRSKKQSKESDTSAMDIRRFLRPSSSSSSTEQSSSPALCAPGPNVPFT